ncbi:FtsW/RodA/SpoVE family cell cycle protein [Cytobacillus sp. Hz8]|uniref:FtsW/RodA/SpoVE family cell cycle protein n=1 Tax=Cytobacillus sp. Hz8 TaxID=3347168 RepID=UPI0035E03C32
MNKNSDYFLNEVMTYIQSKEAKKLIASELEFHLQNAKASWIKKGLDEEEAERKAVEQMGSPIQLGLELNKLHRPKIDWWIISLLVISMGFGFLPIVSLENKDFFINKGIMIMIGTVVAFGVMMFDYRKLEKYGWSFFVVGGLILLILIFFPNGIINGQPFIHIGPFTIEGLMAIPFFYLAWASFFNHYRLKIWHFFLLFLLTFYLFLNITNLSTTFLYSLMVFVMLWWSKLGKRKAFYITSIFLGISIIGGISIWFTAKSYQLARIIGYLHPKDHADGSGYVYVHLKKMMASSNWVGSTGNVDLPEAHTDLVFATLINHYGYLLAFVLVGILLLLVFRMISISQKVSHSYGYMLLVGSITLFVIQLIYNIGMTLGMLPIISISLPFVSYGLMPILLNAFLIGIVLSIYRWKNLIANHI